MDNKTSEKVLENWLEANNPGGFNFSNPPPRALIEAAFPHIDVDEVDYLIRKPSRIYERFTS